MRYLLINADDFGIGPATSAGILRLAQAGVVTSSVLLANSIHAETSIQTWRKAGATLELGWHPALTLDGPLTEPGRIPTLVDKDGKFFHLGEFLRRIVTRRIAPEEIELELTAQHRRCTELLGTPPAIVNCHHHIHIFSPIGAILRKILSRQNPKPYLRLVREPWPIVFRIRGVRVKRFVLNRFGRKAARGQREAGFHANDWLIGVSNATGVLAPDFFTRWIKMAPGNVVELAVHPGLEDHTLIGRDCTEHDGMIRRRVQELALLLDPSLPEAIKKAGFTLVSPSQLYAIRNGATSHAA